MFQKNDLEFYAFDDEATIEDDFYDDFITITSTGVLTYDPMTYMAQTTSSIPDWSLNSVMVYAQDDQESKAFSLKMNFLVVAVSFTVERVLIRAPSPLTTRPNSGAWGFQEAPSSHDLRTETPS